MTRGRLLFVLLIVGGIAGIGLGLRHEPRFYRQAELEPGSFRKELCKAGMQQMFGIYNQVADPHGKDWEFSITDKQFNAFLIERLHQFISEIPKDESVVEEQEAAPKGEGVAETVKESKKSEGDGKKLDVHQPRIAFDGDRIQLGFRYGKGFWSTVLSYELKIWLAPNEHNAILVEVTNRKIGGLPLPTQSLLFEIADLGRRHNAQINWYRSEQNNPVALLKFNSNRQQTRPTLTAVRVEQGRISVAGRNPPQDDRAQDDKIGKSIPPTAD